MGVGQWRVGAACRQRAPLFPTRLLPTHHLTGKNMKARIKVTLKHGVLDPQGKAIQNALASLGFTGVNDVRQGKYIEVDLAEANEAQGARAGGADMQRASRQYRDRELRLRARAVRPACMSRELPRPRFAVQGSSAGGARAGRCARGRHRRRRGRQRHQDLRELPSCATAWRCPRAAATTKGPGTLDAICSPDLDPEKSAAASAAVALVLEVGVEPVPADAGASRLPSWRSATARRSSRTSWPRPSAASPTGPRSRSTTPSRFSKRRESCTQPTSPAPRSSSWGSASVAPRCSS